MKNKKDKITGQTIDEPINWRFCFFCCTNLANYQMPNKQIPNKWSLTRQPKFDHRFEINGWLLEFRMRKKGEGGGGGGGDFEWKSGKKEIEIFSIDFIECFLIAFLLLCSFVWPFLSRSSMWLVIQKIKLSLIITFTERPNIWVVVNGIGRNFFHSTNQVGNFVSSFQSEC